MKEEKQRKEKKKKEEKQKKKVKERTTKEKGIQGGRGEGVKGKGEAVEEEEEQDKEIRVKPTWCYRKRKQIKRDIKQSKLFTARTCSAFLCFLSPSHVAPASGRFSWCTSGPPASVLPARLRSAQSAPSYH